MPEIIEITDIHAPELDIFARLSEPQLLHYNEPEAGLFIAESPKVIERALDAGYEPVALLLQRVHITGEARMIVERCADVPIYTAENSVLEQITGFKLTRGALCAMRRNQLPNVTEICEGKSRVAVLENVVNPTNVGAIFRCAAALGMDAFLLTADCSDPLYRRSARVAMGTVFQIPWTYLDTRLVDTALLNKLGFKTAAMALSGNSVGIDDERLLNEERLAVILGTEGEGLAAETIAKSDYNVKIPMYHGVDSLNVAAASAVMFWELRKR